MGIRYFFLRKREKVKSKPEKGTLHPLITYYPLTATRCYSLRLHDKTYKSKFAGGGSGAASFSAPGFVFIFFFISFFNFSFGSDPIKRSL